jgi:hypothetical protein
MSQLERLYRIEPTLLNAPAVGFERLQERQIMMRPHP